MAKKCKHCKEPFTPIRTSLEKYCLKRECTKEFIRVEKEKAWRKRKKKMKEGIMTHSDWTLKAQKYFNEYIRERDKNLPCISCGINQGQFHAGHFWSTGNYPSVRFNEDNVHKQCAQCNNYKGGNLNEYRPKLIAKIGKENFHELERNAHQTELKMTIPEIKGLIEYYKLKTKNMRGEYK